MEKANSVFLNGTVGDCRILGRDGNVSAVAGISFYTLLQKPGASREAKLTDRNTLMRHMVRVKAEGGEDVKRLLELERSCRTQTVLRPHELRGVLREKEGSSFIDCRSEDFVPVRKILEDVKQNNRASMVGSVIATTHTDDFAKVVVDTGEGQVSAFFPKETFPEAWEAIAGGRFKKGSVLSMKGPLQSQEYTDGDRSVFTSIVTPHVMEQVRLSKTLKERKTGPSIG